MAKIDLGGGYETRIDEEDVAAISELNWSIQKIGKNHIYAISTRRPRLLMHRLICGAVAGQVVDHINGDGLDNRRLNLRICTFSENLRNRKIAASSGQPYKGICQGRHKTRWTARIGSGQRGAENPRRTIGWFDSAEEAALAYDKAAVALYGEFACLNFPHLFPEFAYRKAG